MSPDSDSWEGGSQSSLRLGVGRESWPLGVAPVTVTVLRASSVVTMVMVLTLGAGEEGRSREGSGFWAHMAHETPPSFKILIRL